MAMVRDDVYSLNDVGMLEGGADAEFCGDFFLVFLLGLSAPLRAELFDGEDVAAVLATGLDEADGAAGTGAQDAAPFTVLLA